MPTQIALASCPKCGRLLPRSLWRAHHANPCNLLPVNTGQTTDERLAAGRARLKPAAAPRPTACAACGAVQPDAGAARQHPSTAACRLAVEARACGADWVGFRSDAPTWPGIPRDVRVESVGGALYWARSQADPQGPPLRLTSAIHGYGILCPAWALALAVADARRSRQDLVDADDLAKLPECMSRWAACRAAGGLTDEAQDYCRERALLALMGGA